MQAWLVYLVMLPCGLHIDPVGSVSHTLAVKAVISD